MCSVKSETPSNGQRCVRLLQVFTLATFAPICAEYLSAYDSSTGDPLVLLQGLIILAPLYGFAAVLIRELVSRSDLGMRGTLLLAAAFGVVQAGVIDQSMFRESYLGIAVWDQMTKPTQIPQLGISAYTATTFVAGHVIYSYVAPILIVESLCPASSRNRWLSRLGVSIIVVLYVVSALLVLDEHLSIEDSHASTTEISCALALSMFLVAGAYSRPQRYFESVGRFEMSATWLFLIGLIGGISMDLAAPSWLGTIVVIFTLACLAAVAFFARLSRTRLTALAFGLLLSRCLTAFSYFPLRGDVSALQKYSHNVFFIVVVLVFGMMSLRRASQCTLAEAHDG
ncbi:hypothetical protein [Rubripirellula reticaptiva]|uniref:Uncharacterized protein n=1 Tax=Rubripirellula reticaptiva TaxID=2528013 RepID=A0A5C6EXT8_9BACT|nr:hypothetical protein [Rubripirellula reticaptiva]TWU52041.1 hypothetical protein Poly59_36380 [Rubripirellula reticaptiva]